jgi:predicted nucleic acid-binding protein
MYYRSDLKKIVGGLQELRKNGADIRFVPAGDESFNICDNVPDLMEKHSLFSADALHLSLALSLAKTLITFDVQDFKTVVDPAQDLTILLLPS